MEPRVILNILCVIPETCCANDEIEPAINARGRDSSRGSNSAVMYGETPLLGLPAGGAKGRATPTNLHVDTLSYRRSELQHSASAVSPCAICRVTRTRAQNTCVSMGTAKQQRPSAPYTFAVA